jgi:RNA polymerase sigma-70 factor (ECF subfamily)
VIRENPWLICLKIRISQKSIGPVTFRLISRINRTRKPVTTEMQLKVVENDTDERLLIEAAQRDPSCFAELYENNFERVYAFFARRVASREEAQDLTAEVFHQALADIRNFEWRGTPFVAWLLGIAGNVLSAHWQRTAKRQEVSANDLELAGKDGNMERRAMIFQLVESLAEDQRQVIVRRFVEQRSIREIAQEFSHSEGAIKQLQLRALRNLRNLLRSNHEQLEFRRRTRSGRGSAARQP